MGKKYHWYYKLYIRIKYFFWKHYWRIFPPKGHPQFWRDREYDYSNKNGIALGAITNFGNPFFVKTTKVFFNNKDYGIVRVHARRNNGY